MNASELRLWFGGLVLIVLFHAVFPRYEWRIVGEVPWRVDRWSGTITPPNGHSWPHATTP